MSKKIFIGVVFIAIVVAGAYFFVRKQYQTRTIQPSVQQSTTQQQTLATTNAITIQNFAFNPSALTVKQGTEVRWTNQDSAPHKITSSAFHSGDLNRGDTFVFTFDVKGSFDYSCSIHPSMIGKIIVE